MDIQFRQIQLRLEEAGIRLEATDEVLDFLGEQGFDPQFGARPLKRVLQRLVLNELSKDISLFAFIKSPAGNLSAGLFAFWLITSYFLFP
jgi:ATP-dependent Clp protease ATP-binding subunit ClpA